MLTMGMALEATVDGCHGGGGSYNTLFGIRLPYNLNEFKILKIGVIVKISR